MRGNDRQQAIEKTGRERAEGARLTASPLLTFGAVTFNQHGPMIFRSTTRRSKGVAVVPNTCE